MSAGSDAAESAKDNPKEMRVRRLAKIGLSEKLAALYLLADAARCTGAPPEAVTVVADEAARIRAVW